MKNFNTTFISLLFILFSCAKAEFTEVPNESAGATPKLKTVVLAGGCFWCVEADFEKVPGVTKAVSGYIGGSKSDANYNDVSAHKTKHREAVSITYDENLIKYDDLLKIYWNKIDPLDDKGQFADKGFQYTSAVYFNDSSEQEKALQVKNELESKLSAKVKTQILPVSDFYPAEEYHQDYYKKNALKYNLYRKFSGRDDKIKNKLTPIQYEVTQKNGTEPPFQNEYWDNKQDGIYVDIITGEPLFSSKDQFSSKTGWPSFTKPIDSRVVSSNSDLAHGMSRTEIRSKSSNAHLGHVFNDGPAPLGTRYCVNSASLKFIPKDKLKENGLEDFMNDFK